MIPKIISKSADFHLPDLSREGEGSISLSIENEKSPTAIAFRTFLDQMHVELRDSSNANIYLSYRTNKEGRITYITSEKAEYTNLNGDRTQGYKCFTLEYDERQKGFVYKTGVFVDGIIDNNPDSGLHFNATTNVHNDTNAHKLARKVFTQNRLEIARLTT